MALVEIRNLWVHYGEVRAVRGNRIAMIFQEPMTSLNPVLTIGHQVSEPIIVHRNTSKEAALKESIKLLTSVKIPAAETRVGAYPHHFSGGMRQRVVGAIGISCQPQVLIADEPTTSLDVTIQAQYLKLLKDIQKDSDLSLIFITHDFGIVAKMCDRVAVMYAGRIVEHGSVRDIFNNPSHPYTEALLSSVPKMDQDVDRLFSIEGQPPPLHDLPVGCAFADRCPVVMDKCREQYPDSFTVSESHIASCWRVSE